MGEKKYSGNGIWRRDANGRNVLEGWHHSHDVDGGDIRRNLGTATVECRGCGGQIRINYDGTCVNQLFGTKCVDLKPVVDARRHAQRAIREALAEIERFTDDPATNAEDLVSAKNDLRLVVRFLRGEDGRRD